MATTRTTSSKPRALDGIWPISPELGYLLIAIVAWLNGIAIGRLVR
jgi:hypothetical protein